MTAWRGIQDVGLAPASPVEWRSNSANRSPTVPAAASACCSMQPAMARATAARTRSSGLDSSGVTEAR
jgi:hypothetical protein